MAHDVGEAHVTALPRRSPPPAALDVGAQPLQVGDQRHDLLVLEVRRAALRRDATARWPAACVRAMAGASVTASPYGTPSIAIASTRFWIAVEVERVGQQVRVGRHDRLGLDVPRVLHVAHVPEVGVLAALARQVGPDAARAPQERVVVDELARLGVLAVALGLVAERPDHLRVAVEAALADVEVAPGQLERRVRLDRRDGRHVRPDEEGRDDLEQRGHDDRDGHHDGEGDAGAAPSERCQAAWAKRARAPAGAGRRRGSGVAARPAAAAWTTGSS